MTTIIWFREDLRLADQAALAAAAAKEGPVVPVYVLDDESPGKWKTGGAQRWWLHHSLAALGQALEKCGSRLILRRGRASQEVAALAAEVGAERVHAVRHHEPWWRAEQEALAERLELVLHPGRLLVPPGAVETSSGTPYKIFTPFWRALQQHLPPPEPQPAPERLQAPASWPDSEALGDWGLLPTKPNWAAEFGDWWTPGEAGGHERLLHFAEKVEVYAEGRNLPFEDSTSRLSPYLHMGELSPAQVWHAVHKGRSREEVERYLFELGWRDFSTRVIRQYPDYGDTPARDFYARMDLTDHTKGEGRAALEAWRHGRTGYPIVDAGMRQLWRIGWMHNRVRMIAAQFLIKHLLIDWREGAAWFWDTLVDADYGNNMQSWQWSAGTAVDSTPFSRMMNPKTQSPKWQAADYIRHWVPELAELPNSAIHVPWEADDAVLAKAGVRLGETYPQPLVLHKEARERALATFREAKAA